MQIQISTDHNIAGHEAMAAETTTVLEHGHRRFSEPVTRVEVHLGDENGPKAGANNIRSILEARLEGTIPQAVQGAAENLVAPERGRAHD